MPSAVASMRGSSFFTHALLPFSAKTVLSSGVSGLSGVLDDPGALVLPSAFCASVVERAEVPGFLEGSFVAQDAKGTAMASASKIAATRFIELSLSVYQFLMVRSLRLSMVIAVFCAQRTIALFPVTLKALSKV